MQETDCSSSQDSDHFFEAWRVCDGEGAHGGTSGVTGKVLIFDLVSCLPYHNSLSYIFLWVIFCICFIIFKKCKKSEKKIKHVRKTCRPDATLEIITTL